ncbi:MAG: phage holin family protein [Proteobacteria bacterium]|nr:phage holin family protein [Pseudomonadota bacterium]
MSDELRRLPEDDAPTDFRPAAGVREELTRLGVAFSSLLGNRLELARLEYIEAHRQTTKQLVLLILTAALFGVAFIAANVLLVVWFWDTPYRIEVLLWMVGVYFVFGMLMLWRLAVMRKRASKPFSATLAEFEKDRQWLATGLSAKARPATPEKAERDGG